MNDVEHDLRALFDDRARSLRVPSAAPDAVLRRGRRRQMRVLAAGTALVVSVIAIAAAGVVLAGRRDSIPITPPAFPERAATIHGIPVTAPAGWTLIDDWPLATTLPAGSETCSFTGQGSAIPASPVGMAGSAGPTSEPTQSCITEQNPLPAGAPVMQLANFSIPLDGTVCNVDPLRSVSLPDDGVAVYVGAFPAGMSTAEFLSACPGGGTVQTFADRDARLVYAAVSIVGPHASDRDAAVVDGLMTSLEGLRVPSDAPATGTPGYVVAAGGDGETAWRLEAGFPFRGSGSGIGVTLVRSDADGHETASGPVPPTALGEDDEQRAERLADGSGWLQWGTSPPGTTAVTSVAPDGTRTVASIVPWPDGMRPLVRDTEQSQLDGSIWFAVVAEPGRIESAAAGPTSAPPAIEANRLQTRQTDTGDVVIYGTDLGHEWELRHENGRIVLYLDGSSTAAGNVEMLNGLWDIIDVGGGSFVIGSFDDSVDRLWVTVQGSDASIEGGYADAQDRTGAPGRVWLIPLPGSGWGTLENGVATRGWWISWPSVVDLHRGAVLRAGGDGTDVSWSLVYQDDHCVQLEVDTSSVAGLGDCLPPWSDLQRNGGRPLVGGVYGQQLAVIALVLPADASIESFRTDSDQGIDPVCTTIHVESNYASTQFCIFPLAVGSSATITLDAAGDPLGSPFGISAQPGTIDFTQGTATIAGASPSPSP